MILWCILGPGTKGCNSIDRANRGILASRFSSRFRGEPSGPETNHWPVCSTICGIRAAWCAGSVGGDSEMCSCQTLCQYSRKSCVNYASCVSKCWKRAAEAASVRMAWQEFMDFLLEGLHDDLNRRARSFSSKGVPCRQQTSPELLDVFNGKMHLLSNYKKEPARSVWGCFGARHQRQRVSSNVGVYLIVLAPCLLEWHFFFLQLGQVKLVHWALKFCEHLMVAGSSRAGSKSKMRKEPGDPSSTLRLAGTCCERRKGWRVEWWRITGSWES